MVINSFIDNTSRCIQLATTESINTTLQSIKIMSTITIPLTPPLPHIPSSTPPPPPPHSYRCDDSAALVLTNYPLTNIPTISYFI